LALLMILAWMLLAGTGRCWAVMAMGCWPLRAVLIIVMMLIDLGAFIGTQGENKFGKDTLEVQFR
jgi:uncharacterized membrane protein YhaH (DUF805 family)